ncbi:MAG: hypothetical protein QNK23_12865 [Crocinitomicaceae bacterium]|nr:hypothetical protein [Crocinitomicaceae bacterium]
MLVKSANCIAQVENEEIVVSLRIDGIMHVYLKPGVNITVESQARMLDAYGKLTEIPRPFVFEPGEFSSITKEARANAIKIESNSPVLASAIVVNNLGQRILADYYYKFNKPKTPIKIFKNMDLAIEWLTEHHLQDIHKV